MNLCVEIVYLNRKYPLQGFLRFRTGTLSSLVLMDETVKMWGGVGGGRDSAQGRQCHLKQTFRVC